MPDDNIHTDPLQLLTTAEAAKRLRVSARQLRAMVRNGKVRALRIGAAERPRQYRFRLTEIQQALTASEATP